MYYVHQIFICATFCLAALNQGCVADNVIALKNDSSHLITTVGNILTPLLLKQVERRLLNHTAISDGVISIEKLESSTSVPPIGAITTNSELKENEKPSNLPMSNFQPLTVPTTKLLPIDRVKPDSNLRMVKNKSELDSARAQQRQLENQFPFDFRNRFNTGLSGVRQQPNEEIFGNIDSFTSDQFRPLTSLNQQKSYDDILGVQGISGSKFPEKNPIFNDPNQPFNSQILPIDFKKFENFDKFQYDGRYSDPNQFSNPNFQTETGSSTFGVGTDSRAGIGADITRLGDRYNNFAGQLYQQNNLPLHYRQNLRNNFPNSPINNQAINAVINNRPIVPSINNQRVPVELPFRSYINPSLAPHNINENIVPYPQTFQNSFSQNRNLQKEFNYSSLRPQLYFNDYRGNAGSPDSRTPVDFQTAINNNSNNSGVTLSSLIPSRRSDDSVTKSTNNNEKVTTNIPGVKSLQEHVEYEKLFDAQQDDYLDIRVSPDFFKQHILESQILEKYAKKNDV